MESNPFLPSNIGELQKIAESPLTPKKSEDSAANPFLPSNIGELQQIAGQPLEGEKKKEDKGLRETLFPEGGWGLRSAVESTLIGPTRPDSMQSMVSQAGPGGLSSEQKKIVDQIEDPEVIANLPQWHELTDKQLEIKYNNWRNSKLGSDIKEGAKQFGVGVAGMAEGFAQGVGKAIYDPLASGYEISERLNRAKTEEEARQAYTVPLTRAVNVPLAVPSAMAKIGESLADVGARALVAGSGITDKIAANFGRSEDQIKTNWMVREAIKQQEAVIQARNPDTLGRVAEKWLDMGAKKAVKLLVSQQSPTIDEILLARPELNGNREAAAKLKESLDEDKTKEVIDSVLQWRRENPVDPDIEGVVELAGVPFTGIPAINTFAFAEKAAAGALELGKVAKASFLEKAYGPAYQRLQRAQAARAVRQSVESAEEIGRVGQAAGKVADKIDAAGERLKAATESAQSAIPESMRPILEKALPYIVPAAITGGAAVYESPEEGWNKLKSLGRGAMVGGGAALALKTPRLVSDLSKARAAAGGGTAGMWSSLNTLEKPGDLSRFAAKYGPALDFATNHLKDFAENGIRMAPLVVSLGLLESDNTPEFVNSIGQGIGWSIGPQALLKAMGKDPTQFRREQRQNDNQAFKFRRSLGEEQARRFDMFSNIETEVQASTEYLDNAMQEYAKAQEEGADGKKMAVLENNVAKARIRNISAQEIASNPNAANEYSRLLWHQLSDIESHISGAVSPGKNLKINLLSGNEIYQRLVESNKSKLDSLAGPDPSKTSDAQGKFLELLRFVSTAEGAAYLRSQTVEKNGERILKDSGQSILFEPEYGKDVIVLNADVIRENMVKNGQAFASVVAHEAGHVIDGMQEFRDRTAELRERLFGSKKRNASGEVIGDTTQDALFSEEALNKMFFEKYAAGRPESATEVAESLGHLNEDGSVDAEGIAERMRGEVMADFNVVGMHKNFYTNRPKGVSALMDWLGVKDQLGRIARVSKTAPDAGTVFGSRSGAAFSPELQEFARKKAAEIQRLQGMLSPHNPEEAYVPPVPKGQVLANKQLSDYYLTDTGRFQTEMAGVVYDANGVPVSEVILRDPNASEGAWVHQLGEDGESSMTQTRGDRPLSEELKDIPVPAGGYVEVKHRLARDRTGKPIENNNRATKEFIEARKNAIREAIDNSPDLGAPNRMRRLSENSNSYSGTLSPIQIERIKALPDRIVPQSIKSKILELNDAVARNDGSRFLVDYASRIDAKGNYYPFSPKIVDVVPINMMFSNDGHFLARVVSVSRLNSKADRWAAFMPARLAMWGGDKNAFVQELIGKYLQNHSSGIEGSGWRETAEGPQKTPGALSDDYNTAIVKRNIFNDFMNMHDSASFDKNPDRTELPPLKLTKEQRRQDEMVKLTKEQKAAEKSSNQNTMVRSLRLDAILDMAATDLPRVPVDYYKVKQNFSFGEVSQEETAGPREFRLPTFERSAIPRRQPALSLGVAEEDATLVAPGFYSKAGRVLLEKMPNRASMDQIMGILDPQKGSGVKPEELKWSGIIQSINLVQAEKGFVTKEDIKQILKEDYLAEFKTQTMDKGEKVSKYNVTYEGDTETFDTYEDARKAMDHGIRKLYSTLRENSDLYPSISETGEWQITDSKTDEIIDRSRLDDGSYYRFERSYESEDAAQEAIDESIQLDAESMVSLREVKEQGSAKYSDYTLPNGKNYKEIVLTLPGINFKSTHFPDIPSYVAHMRTAEHGNGLLVEEFQSDLHSKARKEGYKEPVPVEELLPKMEEDLAKLVKYRNSLPDQWKRVTKELRSLPARLSERTQEQEERLRVLREFQEEFPNLINDANSAVDDAKETIEAHKSGKKVAYRGKIADAPFRKDWSLQLFKRALQDAVNSGKEWIGWTGGEAQAKRYDLSQYVDVVAYDTVNKKLTASRAGDRVFESDETVEPKDVERYVGKDLAEKLLSSQPIANGIQMAFPEDLKIGGEGMKGFYDNILPKELGKYVKQWGAKVEPSEIGQEKIWKVQITPEMTRGVREGLPLFSLGESAQTRSAREEINKTKEDDTRPIELPTGGNRGGGRPAGVYTPLEGAPRVDGASGPDPRLNAVFEQYARRKGIPIRRQAEYVTVDPERAKRIAAAYEAMPHAPNDPAVREAYSDLINQTRDQYDALMDAGYKAWFMDPDADPYAGKPWNAMRDLRKNQSMAVFPTEAGFGSGDTELNVSDNPMLAETGLMWPYGSPDGPLKRVLANDLFRYVHDTAHGIEGAGFRADGEENAWQAHSRLFTGPALGALTSETRGQNSWLNFGPHGEKNKTAKVEDTIFADQKTGLMPEWTWTEGVARDEAQEPSVEGTLRDVQFSLGEMSKPDTEHDRLRVGTALLGTEARPVDTPQTSNIMGSIVPDKLLASQLAKMNYPHMPESILSEADPKIKRDKMVQFMKQNLKALYDAFPEEYRARATKWYDGARKLADELSALHGDVSPEQAAGILAVFSPQKDWFMNVAQGYQCVDIYKNEQNTVITPELARTEIEKIIEAAQAPVKQKIKAPKGKKETPRQKTIRANKNKALDKQAKQKRREVLEQLYGKTISELSDGTEEGDVLQAWGIRVLAQIKFGRQYKNISPEGNMLDNAKNKKGDKELTNTWGSTGEIRKAVSIMKDGSLKNISDNLGDEHKVRNFYNNIVAPNSPFGDATIDTHAVAAAHLMPYGSSAEAVTHNFGGSGKSAPLGISGSYHVYMDAYQQLAKELGILPRQLQSITWEAIRELYPSEERSPKLVNQAVEIWKRNNEDESRRYILRNGISAPVWARATND